MKILAVAGVSLVALAAAAPAFAADLPAPAAPVMYDQAQVSDARFDWSGFYFGANAGWAWGEFKNSSALTGNVKSSTNGPTIGIHGGYNYQITPNFLAGAEADFQYRDLDKRSSGNGVSIKNSSNWNGSLRARAGVVFDRLMVYSTGGLAIANMETNVAGTKRDETKTGWVLGAGVEGALTNNITARVEYLHSDYGRDNFDVGGVSQRVKLQDNVTRVGLSYKF